jgi:hypothetical protein
MLRLIALILFAFPSFSGGIGAQRLFPESVGQTDQQTAYLDSLFDAHQYFRNQESGVLLKYGYHSADHLALLDSIQETDHQLRDEVESFLVNFGFPSSPSPRELEQSYRKLMQEFIKTSPGDSLRRDSLLQVIQTRYEAPPRRLDHRNTIMVILDTESDFSLRCRMISYLKEEWHAGNLPTASLLVYLRHTYQLNWGEELPIASGTSEEERLMMYARELSGCW